MQSSWGHQAGQTRYLVTLFAVLPSATILPGGRGQH